MNDQEIFLLQVGQLVRRYRRLMNMTQADLAAKVGFLRTSICNIEAGTQDTTITRLFLIAAALDVQPSCFMPLAEIERSESARTRRLGDATVKPRGKNELVDAEMAAFGREALAKYGRR